MASEDNWEMEPCLRRFECEPARNGGDWRCQFCGVEMLMMRVIRPEPSPTAEELAARKAQAEWLAAAMTDPNPEPDLGPKGKLPGETDEEMISRVCKEVREGPEPRQNAGGPGCWRTPEPEFDDGVDDGVPVVWQPGDPPGGVAEIEARFAEEILAGNIQGPAQAFAELRKEYEDRLAAKRAADEGKE